MTTSRQQLLHFRHLENKTYDRIYAELKTPTVQEFVFIRPGRLAEAPAWFSSSSLAKEGRRG
jgi:hypothetical protein